jgi:hypothetical protein
MHGGCQFGIFANLLFLRRLAVLIWETLALGVSKREIIQESNNKVASVSSSRDSAAEQRGQNRMSWR